MSTARSQKRSGSAGRGITPLMKQYYAIKKQYPDALVLFRMGDFYETFDGDAKIASKVLGIALTKRANGAAAHVPLAGFPHHALNTYLPRLVETGLRVAICEQVEDPKMAKGIVKREVVEVVTPGTAISDSYLDQKSNNFLGAVLENDTEVGFAFLDHATGEFYLGESSNDKFVENMIKFSPREMIVPEALDYQEKEWYKKTRPFITEMDEWAFHHNTSRDALLQHFKTTSLKGFGCEDLALGIAAAGVILRYVEHTIHGGLDHVTKLIPLRDDDIMGLDDFTIRNLELFASLSTQGAHGTLISILDRTVTTGGGRLLRRRMKRPLTDRTRIEERLNLVEGFVNHSGLASEVRRRLSNCSDLERLVGKLSRAKATPRDLAALRLTLELIPPIAELLTQSESDVLRTLAGKFEDTSGVSAKIKQIIVDSPPLSLAEGGVISDGVDGELDELRAIARGGKEWIARLEQTERKRTGIPSLKVGYNKVFGYYLEVTNVHQKKVPEDYIRKQTLVNAERFVTPGLKEYEEKILNAEEKVLEIETRIFHDLRRKLLESASQLQHNAVLLNQIDLFAALGDVAITNKYTKPTLVEEPRILLRDSRHPVVEAILPTGEKFVPNDLKTSTDDDQILLVTGPNMAGKSTYLRQTGLIVIMAQMGSFVPAREAVLGIVDRLFTRVGASDNLAGGESTFLVEMIEAANILNNATSRSLVLFDEIGRGTATFDGLSLAWAITEYLHNNPGSQARTVFATHYHELTELEHILGRVRNYNVAVKEFGDKIVFLRKIMPGSCDKSYGIHVAQMAGLPKSVINRASQILNQLIKHESGEIRGTSTGEEAWNQLAMFTEKESKLQEVVSQLDTDSMTPLEALSKLDELKKNFGK